MIISYIFPQKIYLNNNNTIQNVIKDFNLNTNQTANLVVGEWFCANNMSFSTNCYVVKPLDTITTVAKKLNMSEECLKKLTKTNHLFIGQKIIID